MADPLNEKNESLWRLIVSPTIWAAHFMLSYLTAAIWCAKFAPSDDSLAPVQWAIGAYTLAALICIGLKGWRGVRRHRLGSEPLPHDFDTAEDRHRFLGFATGLLAALSGVSTIYVALVALFFRSCR